jgi:dTDP-4-amino-4,6-dideoxygalactose transaminase
LTSSTPDPDKKSRVIIVDLAVETGLDLAKVEGVVSAFAQHGLVELGHRRRSAARRSEGAASVSGMAAPATRTIPFGRPWLNDDDRKAVADVLDQPILAHGPQSAAFEDEFARFMGDGAHCVSVSSCAAALHLAYSYFGVGPGDEVIVPAETHAATANTAEWVGATSVFVDCDDATGNMTADAIRAAITPRTKAITVVHFVGIPCDMRPIAALAREHGIPLVEDCALAVGARIDGTHVGLFGDVGCFSFYPVKHITTAEGGMFVSKHADVASRVARLRAHGVDRSHGERAIPGMYDVPTIGLNYRLSEIQAALGRSQLRRIDEILERRRANFAALKVGLAGAPVRVLDGTGNSHYCLSIVLEGDVASKRNDVLRGLGERGVGASVYYPQPVPRMTYYREKYGYDASSYTGAEDVSDRGIALPVGPHLEEGDGEAIAAAVRAVVEDAA